MTDHRESFPDDAGAERRMRRTCVALLATLCDAVVAKDPYAHGSCALTARRARLTAERMGLGDDECAVACYAALLHDVGKVGIADGILNKPGPLLPEELELVRAHVRIGHDLVAGVPGLEPVARAILHHHEWFDGSGYPDARREVDIPTASRIVAVVDAYTAMTSRRSYKPAYPDDQARMELRRHSGTQFDPRVVVAFLDVLDSPDLAADPDAPFDCGPLPGFGAG